MLEQVSQPVAALNRLTDAGTVDPGALEAFLEEHAFPLQDGPVTTFVYRGEAEAVRLHHWLTGAPNSQPFVHHQGSELWHLTLALPDESRIEYKLEIQINGENRLIYDPLNPLLAHDPFGANSVCYGPGYTIPDWTLPDPNAEPGTIERLTVPSTALATDREVGVYLPAGFDPDQRYPTLLVHDGRDYVRYCGLKTVLDNLIHRREIAPLVVALTEPADRLREYAGDPRHAQFLADELLPSLEERFGVAGEAQTRGLMGASFGAVASLYTAWRYPRNFGRLLLQSGSFVATRRGQHRRGPEFRPVVAFTQLFRTSPRRVSERVYVSCGLYESVIHHNRELVPLLQTAGTEVLYREARDGHNWENWRDRLAEGLSFLFPYKEES